jgi:CubicO group peptidase (beta-lactamase class C family)
LLLIALVPTACVGQGIQQDPQFDVTEAEAMARRFVDDEWASGMVIAIVQDDQIEIRGYGKATEDGAAPDEHTLFELGSVAKVFTALTLATMVSDGKVALDDPVEEFLPATVRVPDHEGTEITLLSLATHTSGLPRLDSFNTEWAAGWLYEFLADYTLERDPGTHYEYSNLGMGLLGHALSVREEKPFGDLVNERVLVPLGMSHTFVGASPAELRLSQGYDIEGAPLQRIPAWGSGVLAPAAAMRSDAMDMAVFVQANFRPPRSLRDAILSTQMERTSHLDEKIGLGWHIGIEGAPSALVHNGGIAGYHSFIAIDVEKRSGVVVLANTQTMAVDALGRALFRMLHGEPPDLELPRLVTVSHDALDRCAGRYEIEPGFELTITRENGTLFAQTTEGERYRVYPSSETTFHYRVDDASLHFEIGADGQAKRVLIRTSDETAPADRIE